MVIKLEIFVRFFVAGGGGVFIKVQNFLAPVRMPLSKVSHTIMHQSIEIPAPPPPGYSGDLTRKKT